MNKIDIDAVKYMKTLLRSYSDYDMAVADIPALIEDYMCHNSLPQLIKQFTYVSTSNSYSKYIAYRSFNSIYYEDKEAQSYTDLVMHRVFNASGVIKIIACSNI